MAPALTRIGLSLGVSVMRGVYWLLRRFPEQQALNLSREISRVLALPSAPARRRAQRVLFPPRTTDALERAHLAYLSRLRLHGARLALETAESIRERVSVEGEEHLREARGRDRGVMVVSGHMGSWLHILPALAGRGHPMLFLVNPALPRLTRYLDEVATRHGFALASVGDQANDAARLHFRRGGVLYVAIDATVHPERSVWLRFGPAEILVDPGPAVLALRHRVPVIWASTFHDDAGRSRVILSPPMDVGPGTPWTRSGGLIQAWLDLLWSDVALRPGQWWPIAYVPIRAPAAEPQESAPSAPVAVT